MLLDGPEEELLLEVAVDSERSVAATLGSVVIAVTPEVLLVAKLTPVGSFPFSPL